VRDCDGEKNGMENKKPHRQYAMTLYKCHLIVPERWS
jgi:hypothetical protein